MSDSDPTAKPAPPPPPDLVKFGRKDGAGRRLWKQIVTSRKYDLRPDELMILEHACREADLIDEIALEAKGADKLVRGSMGQRVINPLISELRQHRTTLATLLGKLKLPDDAPAGGQVPRSVSARNAASSRWDKTG